MRPLYMHGSQSQWAVPCGLGATERHLELGWWRVTQNGGYVFEAAFHDHTSVRSLSTDYNNKKCIEEGFCS